MVTSILRFRVFHIGVIASSLMALAGCSGNPDESGADTVNSSGEPIVRGSADDGHPSVVGVITWYNKDYAMHVAACSGTYVAPRLVLTAAHCLPENRFVYATRVFYGSDLKSAFDALGDRWYETPAPDSPWAMAQTFKAYPGFDTTTYFGDIAAVSLDRELPIPTTPIARWRLDDRDIGQPATVVGFGATSSDKLLTQTEGWGLKRVGQTRFLGSPSATTETDHPGIGLESVRRSLAMFDGKAPDANPCAGDSGGPVLMRHGSKPYVFGVSTWTGYYCEDYSFYTRVESFLPFIDDAIEHAGSSPVNLSVECARDLGDGLTRVYFSYDNTNNVSLDIPHGQANRMPADTANLRPTHFLLGKQPYAMAADYADLKDVYWKLRSPGGDTSVVSKHTPRPACAPDDFAPVAADACLAMAGAHCAQSMSECVANQEWQYVPDDPTLCPAEFLAWNQCQGTLTPADFECDSSGYSATDVSETCMDAQNAYFACLFFGPGQASPLARTKAR